MKDDLSWLSNLTLPVTIVAIIIARKESRSWRFKKRAETAANILSAFRFLSNKIKKIINMRIHLPSFEEEKSENYNERKCPEAKVFHYWDDFFAIVDPLIVHFPTNKVEKLEIFINNLDKLIKHISGQIRILNEDESVKSFTKEQVIQANQALNELPNQLKQFYKDLEIILSKYIDVFD